MIYYINYIYSGKVVAGEAKYIAASVTNDSRRST